MTVGSSAYEKLQVRVSACVCLTRLGISFSVTLGRRWRNRARATRASHTSVRCTGMTVAAHVSRAQTYHSKGIHTCTIRKRTRKHMVTHIYTYMQKDTQADVWRLESSSHSVCGGLASTHPGALWHEPLPLPITTAPITDSRLQHVLSLMIVRNCMRSGASLEFVIRRA